jgi:hypothetical protein
MLRQNAARRVQTSSKNSKKPVSEDRSYNVLQFMQKEADEHKIVTPVSNVRGRVESLRDL